MSHESLAAHQLRRLNEMLSIILPRNRFYQEKLSGQIDESRLGRPGGPCESLEEFSRLPFTFKEELQSAIHPGELAANLTYPREKYVRYHRTSGTRGRPLAVLDTADDWAWWLDCWQYVLDAAEIQSGDCLLMAFSFGPFIGFWSAYDAAQARGCLVVPGGGMGSVARLELLRASGATALFCTPSYALHLAEVGLDQKIDVARLGVKHLVLAGEPGGSISEVRLAIEAAWNGRVIDHGGATEVGAWGVGDAEGRGLHVLENEFVAEFLSVESGAPAAEGELAELVLTNLGRVGCPVIRYRTGDLVRPIWSHPGPNRFVLLDGGVLGRADDMLIIRGVNVFPSSVDRIMRGFPEIVEYQVVVRQTSAMDHLVVRVEDRLNNPERIAREIRLRLGLKVDVEVAPMGSLPRFEGKARRWIDERPKRGETAAGS